jgi:SAM-dependent methyltransferase
MSMAIEYDHSQKCHTVTGARAVLDAIFRDGRPQSLLDVGCGTGTWLKAAEDLGVTDLMGLDGIELPPAQLHVATEIVHRHDLTLPWSLGRQFELVLCLEVAEHLDSSSAETLIDSLVSHGKQIYFSAACPGQIGQHHVNCQWPSYWQRLFNDRSYVCDDTLRWQIWDDDRIEPWYRQNIFLARRAPDDAGREPRIAGIVHPGILRISEDYGLTHLQRLRHIEEGRLPMTWYMSKPVQAFFSKLQRRRSK